MELRKLDSVLSSPLDSRNPQKMLGRLLSLVGLESDSMNDSSARIEHDGIPDERWIGYLWPRDQALHWYPPNMIQAAMEIGDGPYEEAVVENLVGRHLDKIWSVIWQSRRTVSC